MSVEERQRLLAYLGDAPARRLCGTEVEAVEDELDLEHVRSCFCFLVRLTDPFSLLLQQLCENYLSKLYTSCEQCFTSLGLPDGRTALRWCYQRMASRRYRLAARFFWVVFS